MFSYRHCMRDFRYSASGGKDLNAGFSSKYTSSALIIISKTIPFKIKPFFRQA